MGSTQPSAPLLFWNHLYTTYVNQLICPHPIGEEPDKMIGLETKCVGGYEIIDVSERSMSAMRLTDDVNDLPIAVKSGKVQQKNPVLCFCAWALVTSYYSSKPAKALGRWTGAFTGPIIPIIGRQSPVRLQVLSGDRRRADFRLQRLETRQEPYGIIALDQL